MSGLSSAKQKFFEKQRDSFAKIESLQENFAKKKKSITQDLEKAAKIWTKVGKKFKWWQSLP